MNPRIVNEVGFNFSEMKENSDTYGQTAILLDHLTDALGIGAFGKTERPMNR